MQGEDEAGDRAGRRSGSLDAALRALGPIEPGRALDARVLAASASALAGERAPAEAASTGWLAVASRGALALGVTAVVIAQLAWAVRAAGDLY